MFFDLRVAQEGVEPILGAAYALIDRAYVILSGKPRTRLIVRLRSKRKASRRGLERLAHEFENELARRRSA